MSGRTGRWATAAVVAASAVAVFSPVTARASASSVGELAYISQGSVYVVPVSSDTSTGSPDRIAPTAQPRGVTTASNLEASSDGTWLAWLESDPKTGSIAVVAMDVVTGRQVRLTHASYPLGFAGDTLVVIGKGERAARLVLKPKPHLVTVADTNYPDAVYPHGVIDLVTHSSKRGTPTSSTVRLNSFSGQHVSVHRYAGSKSLPYLAGELASSDGKQLLVEVGDEEGFYGTQASDFDEYALDDGHTRTPLGHYATGSTAWQMNDGTFVGPDDVPWLTVYGSSRSGTRSDLVRYVNGAWQLVASDVITVLGRSDGYVVYQPGKWVLGKHAEDDVPTQRPTTDAQLWFDGSARSLGLTGTEFAWVTNLRS